MKAAVVALVLLFIAQPCLANGGKGNGAVLIARLQQEGGSCDFSTVVDPVVFAATSLADKFRLIHVRVVNHGNAPLKMDAEKDTVKVEFGGRAVDAIIDLAKHDPATWDDLPAPLRQVLAYPAAVEAGEEEGVMLFLPDMTLDVPPDAITFAIHGIEALTLRAPVAGL